MPSNLASKLQRSHTRTFVGRSAECDLFAQALRAKEPPFVLLHIHGPGGMGKTSLLRQYIWLAEQQGVPTFYINGEEIDATPADFLHALDAVLATGQLDGPNNGTPIEALAALTQRHVLLIDTFEKIAPLANWLREVLLPQLSSELIIVIGDRHPLPVRWRVHPAWQPLIRSIPLRNLPPDIGRAYLAQQGVPDAAQAEILRFTQGHPLGLALVADTFAQRPDVAFTPLDNPDIVKALLERFVAEVPSPAHRVAVDVAALVRTLDEGLLAHVLEMSDVHGLFQWLRELSMIETRASGVAPHALAREALATDLKWRNPDWHRELIGRIRSYYRLQLDSGNSSRQQETLVDYIYLHRDNPIVKPFFDELQAHAAGGYSVIDGYRPSDRAALVAMVAAHEGATAAALAGRWLDAQPQQARIYRDDAGTAVGYLHILNLESADPILRADDPGTAAVWRYLQSQAPLRTDERAICIRFWLDETNYQALSPIQASVFVTAVRAYLTTPGLAYSFFVCSQPQFWLPLFIYADIPPLPEAAFSIDGHAYGVFAHDWRRVPSTRWLDLLADRETQRTLHPADPPANRPTLVVLSESAFGDAVRDALSACTQPDRLVDNPLMRSRLVIDASDNATDPAMRAAALQKLMAEAAEPLQHDPRRIKYYRALYHACLQPATTHEAAAEIIDVPYGTFRRHLKRAIEYVTADLWQRELA